MQGIVWRSLLMRIVLLAIVSCLFLFVAAGSFFYFLRGSYASRVEEAQQHLMRVGVEFAATYTQQAASGVSLLRMPLKPLPSGPRERPDAVGPQPPPLRAPDGPAPPPAPPPLPVDPLSSVTAIALQREQGIEGGFLAGDGPLVGYAFPTHEGPGLQKEMPQRERPTIERLAREAKATDSPKTFVYQGTHDVVLFAARPVREEVKGREQVTGAVWLMERLPDLNRGRSRQLLFAAVGAGSAALLCALLAWFVTVEIQGGVQGVIRHLADLEVDLAHAGRPAELPKLVEFARVMNGIDALAESLQHRIESERNLEMELRHKERLSSLGQFAAGVAHELRNPLATIRLRTQMAQDGSAEELVARSSKVILEEVDRLDAMIGKLLHFARPITLDPQPIALEELCAAAAASRRGRLPESVRLVQRCPVGLVIVSDRGRLLQVLDNLIENAVQALRTGGGEVVMKALGKEGRLQIRIADTGAGFSPTALKHAFDPFFTTKDTGTGLGLSIAFEIVQALGGELTAENRAEGGAVVIVELPTGAIPDEVTA